MSLKRCLIAAGLLLAGCGGDDSTSQTAGPPPPNITSTSSTPMAAPSTIASTTTTSNAPAPPPPRPTARPAAKPRASRSTTARPQPGPQTGDLLARIRRCESGGNYQAQNPRSTASGAYQMLDSTFKSWQAAYGEKGLYARAKDAPPAYQDRLAAAALAAQGPSPWNASRRCWSR